LKSARPSFPDSTRYDAAAIDVRLFGKVSRAADDVDAEAGALPHMLEPGAAPDAARVVTACRGMRGPGRGSHDAPEMESRRA
jgi:hypothetical protein